MHFYFNKKITDINAKTNLDVVGMKFFYDLVGGLHVVILAQI
jgi:hypothetical protein